MVAGRSTHPYIMALSYGATFISTAAIVGFGGTAGVYGMGLLMAHISEHLDWYIYSICVLWKKNQKNGAQLKCINIS